MVIHEDLTLSQASLQDYVDCHYRFRLRHLDRLEWPSVESETDAGNENRRWEGAEFHRMVHQYLLGVPAEKLQKAAEYRSRLREGDNLVDWWHAFCKYRPADGPGEAFPEVMLAAGVLGQRIAAKFDLVMIEESGRVGIFDWKTASRRPDTNIIERRLQTHIYPYLLSLSGSILNDGKPIYPEQIEMRYWFASFPTQPEVIRYDDSRFTADDELIRSLVREILERPINDFSRTEDLRHCGLCTYRSLCKRDEVVGQGDQDEDQAQIMPSQTWIEAGEDTIEFDYPSVEEMPF